MRSPAEQQDPHRPGFHFVPPSGWLNDPNGLCQWQGRFHLFYQHNPDAPVHGNVHWGHASSDDLLHWTDEPVALAPGPDGADRDGCWSGVLVDDGGVPTLVYSGHRDDVGQRMCLATGSPDLRTWTKDPGNPLVPERPPGVDLTEYRDHCVWREGGEWRQLMGAGIRGRGGTALLYRSPDLRSWEYVGPLLVGDAGVREPVWTGTVWECVDLFRLGADGEAHPDVLVFSAWDAEVPQHSVCSTGRYTGDSFEVARSELLDLGLDGFYAPQTFRDDAGRRVMFGWLPEARGADAVAAAGWAGVMSLPRQVRLSADGALLAEPVAEVAELRTQCLLGTSGPLAEGAALALDDVGAGLDVDVELVLPEGAVVELAVRRTPDGGEVTRVVLDGGHGADRVLLTLDRGRASADPDVDGAPRSGLVPVAADRRVRLRVLVDRSVLEVFGNGRPLSARVYPTRPDATGWRLTALSGTVEVVRAQVWLMADVRDGPRSTRQDGAHDPLRSAVRP